MLLDTCQTFPMFPWLIANISYLIGTLVRFLVSWSARDFKWEVKVLLRKVKFNREKMHTSVGAQIFSEWRSATHILYPKFIRIQGEVSRESFINLSRQYFLLIIPYHKCYYNLSQHSFPPRLILCCLTCNLCLLMPYHVLSIITQHEP
jgi:hypothetical protein